MFANSRTVKLTILEINENVSIKDIGDIISFGTPFGKKRFSRVNFFFFMPINQSDTSNKNANEKATVTCAVSVLEYGINPLLFIKQIRLAVLTYIK